MTPDQELLLIFGGLHLVAFLGAGVLFWMFMRSETVTPWEAPDADDDGGGEGGGGGNDRLQRPPKPPRPGGLPLPDAEQSPERFRDHGRLADRHRRQRSRDREVAPEPQRVPAAPHR